MRANEPKRKIVLERDFPGSVKDAWELWTTAEGLESWWGPDGFFVKVHAIDVRPGGVLLYSMTASGAEQRAFLERAGRPTSSDHRVTYVEVEPLRHLAYDHLVGFVPGVPPYETRHEVDFHEAGSGMRLVVTIEAMHDEEMTRMAVMGWTSELTRLWRRLASRAP